MGTREAHQGTGQLLFSAKSTTTKWVVNTSHGTTCVPWVLGEHGGINLEVRRIACASRTESFSSQSIVAARISRNSIARARETGSAEFAPSELRGISLQCTRRKSRRLRRPRSLRYLLAVTRALAALALAGRKRQLQS